MGQSDFTSGVERFFDPDEIIVSKTDLKGRLTYANRPFLELSGYTEKEVLGQPHSMIRHPEMPRCIFKLLWGSIEQGKEIFAYVNNRAKNGDNYWVYAHVTPSLSVDGQVVGYHSNRRVPDRDILEKEVFPLYAKLRSIEGQHTNRKDGLLASEKALNDVLAEKGVEYTEFIVTLGQRRRRGYR
ncbi:PAS domain-containing protein [uncultured Cohaesibacter sp.]|uniref:PAS domain-containing protein n=1 Tax=uncultured Cohaesibacter sp. TaxID=1002546 RepID=UPI0029C659DC|nr:PAS domain-containing protein [uncultured Cohaesibacter sp.]